jgi:catechol 2,3-dioxygenase
VARHTDCSLLTCQADRDRPQKRRCSSRPATGGRPGDDNGGRPDRAKRRFRLIIATSFQRVLRRPLDSAVADTSAARNGMGLTFMSANPGNHHQLVLASGRPDTAGFNPINQISFMVDALADLREVHQRALENGASDMRVTSHGTAWWCYFKDPEGNTMEACLDTPFHVPQPHGEPSGLSKSDEEIMRKAEASCRADPGCMMMDDFQRSLAQRLAG